MSEGGNQDRTFSISALLVICATLSVVLFNRTPFEPSRLAASKFLEHDQQIEARLWEDPFLAVIRGQNRATHPPCYFANYSSGIASQGVKPPQRPCFSLYTSVKPFECDDNIIAVGVMVPGATDAEAEETRIRHRYATLSAFRRLGFTPDDPQHIDFIKISDRTGNNDPKSSMRNILPFERLSHSIRKRKILLLWLNDDLFKNKPLTKLCLFSNFVHNAKSVKVIGPAYSTTLMAMIADASNVKFKRPIEIYSATATADGPGLDQLLKRKQEMSSGGNFGQFWLGDTQCSFNRTVCTDRELAEQIRKELNLRDINCNYKRNHIVLLSEWDTEYGRAVQELYRQVFFKEGDVNIKEQLHIYSYMRGIDGQVPRKDQTTHKSSDTDESSDEKKKVEAKELEHPTGMGQLDYLRRLADEIYSFEQQLEVNGRIRAIGVLGTDFHDKYLVLQAMRQRFPQAVLFTTDLDARLLHPDAQQWSRNLIVASSYNLGLRNDPNINIQGELPPFRDSFQTSVFLAILQAFAADGYLQDPNIKDVVLQGPRAKVFEIGRYRAVDLSEGPANAKSYDPSHREAENSKKLLKKIIILTLATLLLLSLCSEKLRAIMRRAFTTRKTSAATIVTLVVVALGFYLFYRMILLRPFIEEPFSFTEGVSIWPTELLRVISIALSFFFLWRSHLKNKDNTTLISEEFGFNYVAPEEPSRSRPFRKEKDRIGIFKDIDGIFRICSNVVRSDWNIEPRQEEITVDHYWNEYCRRDLPYYRVRRLVLILLSYMVLCGIIISFDPPIAPARGVVSIWIDTVLMRVNIFMFTFLVFTTFDVIRNCRRFIELLVQKQPAWSEKSFDKVLGGHVDTAKEVMKEWLLVHLIAKRTETIGKFVFYPFIVWSISLVSRLHYFDNWQMPVGLVVVTGLGALYAWSCAFLLRRAAEEARSSALDRLTALQALTCAKSVPDQEQLKRIQLMTEAIRSIREGAFAPFTQNPVVQALLVPFGAGGVYLFNLLGNLKP